MTDDCGKTVEVPTAMELSVNHGTGKNFTVDIPPRYAEFYEKMAKLGHATVETILSRALGEYAKAHFELDPEYDGLGMSWQDMILRIYAKQIYFAFALNEHYENTGAGRPVSRQAVSDWFRTGRIPHKRIPAIERLTRGKVTRHDIDPEHYGPPPEAYRARPVHTIHEDVPA